MIFKLPFTWKVPWFQWWTKSAIRNCSYGDLLLSSTFHSSFIHSLIHSNLSPSHVPNLVLGLCGKVETLEHWSQCLWGPPKSSFSLPVWCYFLCLSFTIFHTSASLDGLSVLGSFSPTVASVWNGLLSPNLLLFTFQPPLIFYFTCHFFHMSIQFPKRWQIILFWPQSLLSFSCDTTGNLLRGWTVWDYQICTLKLVGYWQFHMVLFNRKSVHLWNSH